MPYRHPTSIAAANPRTLHNETVKYMYIYGATLVQEWGSRLLLAIAHVATSLHTFSQKAF